MMGEKTLHRVIEAQTKVGPLLEKNKVQRNELDLTEEALRMAEAELNAAWNAHYAAIRTEVAKRSGQASTIEQTRDRVLWQLAKSPPSGHTLWELQSLLGLGHEVIYRHLLTLSKEGLIECLPGDLLPSRWKSL